MEEVNEERMRELDRELEEAIDGDVIQLSLNVIQARMLVCILRAGSYALLHPSSHSYVRGERLMFDLIGRTYRGQSDGLKAVLKQFDDTVEERITSLAEGMAHEQLTEMLGKDSADAMLGLKRKGMDSDDTPGDPSGA